MKPEALGKMLIIVPHQDDEILMTAGIILYATRLGLPLSVCMVTNGDYGCKDQSVGHIRLRETLNSLEYLGLEEQNVYFLGYADTGMEPEKSFLTKLWVSPPEACCPSHCSVSTYALPGHPTWHQQRFGCEASYQRQSLEADLDTLLDTLQPDTIFTTCERDCHGDHSALYRFVDLAAQKRREKPAVYQGVIHSPQGDEHWPLRDGMTAMTVPSGMEGLSPIRLPLPEGLWDASFEEHPKLHALRSHVTAMKPDAIEFLSAFIKTDELFFIPKED